MTLVDMERLAEIAKLSKAGCNLKHEELNALVVYIRAAEEFCGWFVAYPELIPASEAMDKFDKAKDEWKAARKDLGL